MLPGKYELVIHDPTTDFNITELPCLRFEFSYFWKTDADPGSFCDDSEELPTNLFSADGGSVPFGGPQDQDGAVKIYGANFLAPKTDFSYHRILFKNPRDSYFRVFAKTEDKRTDIDFQLFSSANKTTAVLLGSSFFMEEVESSLFLLPAAKNSSDPYMLELIFFRVNKDKPCNYFHFELASKPKAIVEQELLCPVKQDRPPASISFGFENDVNIHGDSFVFSSAQMNNSNTFRHRTRLIVNDKTLVFAEIGYNFLANDFRLNVYNDRYENVLFFHIPIAFDCRYLPG